MKTKKVVRKRDACGPRQVTPARRSVFYDLSSKGEADELIMRSTGMSRTTSVNVPELIS